MGRTQSGSNVKIELSKGSGQTQTLEACDPVASSCDEPYLVGEQPDIKVQLVANAFSYDATNEFYVTATDKAYPKMKVEKVRLPSKLIMKDQLFYFLPLGLKTL